MNELQIIEKLKTEQTATRDELVFLLNNITDSGRETLRRAAQETAQAVEPIQISTSSIPKTEV